MNTNLYIAAQFTFLLGSGFARNVWFDDTHEVWHVEGNGRHFTMDVASDDDEFQFSCQLDGASVTVRFPFQTSEEV